MRQDIAVTLGVVAVVLAVGSLFVCVPAAPFIAISAAVLAVLAWRSGAKWWGIAALTISVLVVISATVYTSYIVNKTVQEIDKALETCWACSGKGWEDCIFCVSGRLTNGYLCTYCGGKGVVTCTICNGTGKSNK